jgi:hypothetical protein
MLEPSACDKFISWDDVESMMRKHIDVRASEMRGYLIYMLVTTETLIHELEQKIKEYPDDSSLKLTLESFKAHKIDLYKQLRVK